MATAVTVAVDLLQHVRVTVGGDDLALRPAGQRLLALLAVEGHTRGGATTRSRCAGLLWPDAGEERSLGNLRSTVWRLPRPAGRPLVHAGPTSLRLGEEVVVDLHAARALIAGILRPDPAAAGPPASLELLRHDIAPGLDDAWLLAARESHRQLRLHALEALCRRLSGAADHAGAVEAGLTALACDPLRESAHRAVVTAHLAEGNVVEALRAYRRCARTFHAELGLPPSAQLRDLVSPYLDRGRRRTTA